MAQDVSPAARTLFREGVGLLKQKPPDYVSAYEKFKAAYADSPSPKILGNLGLCAHKLERWKEAKEAYTAYLNEAPGVTEAERKAIAVELADIEKNGAELTITTGVRGFDVRDERTTRDGKLVVNEYTTNEDTLSVIVRAGSHRLVVSAPDHERAELEVAVEGGDEISKKVELRAEDTTTTTVVKDDPSDADESAGVGMGFWIGFAVTAAAGVAAGVVGGLTVSKHGEFDDAKAARDTARAMELHDEGKTLSITTDVMLGVTGAAAIVTVILLITDLSADDEIADAGLSVTPSGVAISF